MTTGCTGALHQAMAIARAARPQFTPSELRDAIGTPPAIREIFDDVLDEATWPTDRPLRVPNTKHRL